MEKTVLVVDTQPLFRSALVDVVERLGPFKVITADSAEEGFRVALGTALDLLLHDLRLPGISGADATALFRRAHSAPIIVISASDQRQEIAAAIRAGANAVVSKTASSKMIGDVVARALAGTIGEQNWIKPSVSLHIPADIASMFTARQQEIASLLMCGVSNKEIALRLGLSEITIKTHLTTMFRALGAANRTQAVLAIRRLGLSAVLDVPNQVPCGCEQAIASRTATLGARRRPETIMRVALSPA